MLYNDELWIASAGQPIYLNPAMANRHGLITGATGTGKTTTLKVMAESFSAIGVPVFLADVKGDLSGIIMPGNESEKMNRRLDSLGVPQEAWSYTGFPTRFWDLFGEQGHPVRITISDLGPSLIARLLSLTDVQAGVLNLVFHIADEQGLLLIDLKDLRQMLSYCADHRSEFTTEYGNMTPQSIGAIQRALLTLEEEGGECFFGEPALNINDWLMNDEDGRGYINLLNARKLVQSPLLYSTFLLWMLSELFEKLPEEGDLEIPKMVFFFDEAHLLFNDAPKALLDKVTQIVKLIRSKGVGIYFISQSPADIPDSVLGQLQNRVQHALHAYTPAEQKAVKVAATTFRPNPEFSTEEAISNLGVGEALISFLDENGVPAVVEQARILPPQSYMGPADSDKVNEIIASSEMEELYREAFDRESAYEILTAREAEEEAARAMEEEQEELEKEAKAKEKQMKLLEAAERRQAEREAARIEREQRLQEAREIRGYYDSRQNSVYSGSTRSTSGRQYSGSSRTYSGKTYSRSSGTRKSSTGYNTYDSRTGNHIPPEPPVPPMPYPDDYPSFGRPTSRSIDRGLFNTRRY